MRRIHALPRKQPANRTDGEPQSCRASTEKNVVLHFLSFSILEGTQAAGTHQHQILLAVFALSRMHWPGTTKRFVMPVGEPTWLVRLSAPAPTPRAPVTSGSRLPPSALPPPAGALPPTPAPPVPPAATVRLSGRARGSARSNMVKNSWDGAPTSCKTIRGSRLHTS